MSLSVYFLDPDGNKIELLYELPRALWEGDIVSALNHYVAQPENEAAALQRK
jgi:catechol 2,3-dioxygenase